MKSIQNLTQKVFILIVLFVSLNSFAYDHVDTGMTVKEMVLSECYILPEAYDPDLLYSVGSGTHEWFRFKYNLFYKTKEDVLLLVFDRFGKNVFEKNITRIKNSQDVFTSRTYYSGHPNDVDTENTPRYQTAHIKRKVEGYLKSLSSLACD